MTVTTTLSPAPETAASTRTLTVRVRYFAAADALLLPPAGPGRLEAGDPIAYLPVDT